MFTFKTFTNISLKFLTYIVGKFWKGASKNAGEYLLEADIKRKTIQLVVLVPGEVLVCTHLVFSVAFMLQDEPEEEEDEADHNDQASSPPPPPRRSSHKHKAPNSLGTKTQRNMKVKKEQSSLDSKVVKDEPSEGSQGE